MQNITVVGAGTMGNGIAHVFAMHGYPVKLVDISQDMLERGVKTISKNLERMVSKEKMTPEEKAETLARITTHLDLEAACKAADLVVEAATETVRVKLQLFEDIDRVAPAHAILASNTSSISITKIAAATTRPAHVIGMHFMNPVPVMKLVEVIRGYATSQEVINTIVELCGSLGKIPVEVNDYPGFISNRILLPMLKEAIYALFEGVAGVEEIDSVMKLGMAHPMGPLQLADFIGLDVCLSILRVLQSGFGNPRYAPCPLLVNMVEAGRLGRKSGEGFYFYHQDSKAMTVSARFAR